MVIVQLVSEPRGCTVAPPPILSCHHLLGRAGHFPERRRFPLMDRVGAEDGHAHEEEHDGNWGKEHEQNCAHPLVMGTGAGSVPSEPTRTRGGEEDVRGR